MLVVVLGCFPDILSGGSQQDAQQDTYGKGKGDGYGGSRSYGSKGRCDGYGGSDRYGSKGIGDDYGGSDRYDSKGCCYCCG